MNKMIIYGAGVRGKKIGELLAEAGYSILNYCDKKRGGEILINKQNIEIMSVDDCLNIKDAIYVVAINSYVEHKKVKNELISRGLKVKEIEELLYQDNSSVVANRNYIAKYHEVKMEEYYDKAESANSIAVFWDDDSPFLRMFKRLNLENVVELACGHGRHLT